MGAFCRAGRHFKSACFQPFVIQAKTVAFPLQELNMCLSLVEEYKNVSQFHCHVQLIGYKTAQTVETFSHIGPFMIEKVPRRMIDL